MFGGELTSPNQVGVPLAMNVLLVASEQSHTVQWYAVHTNQRSCHHETIDYCSGKSMLEKRSHANCSLIQEKFRHYRDLWRLDLESYEWEQLGAKGGPNARSGHRMALYKDSLVIFGGFHDTGNSCS